MVRKSKMFLGIKPPLSFTTRKELLIRHKPSPTHSFPAVCRTLPTRMYRAGYVPSRL